MDIYLFSGLGADERLFARLQLGQANLHFVKWPMPHAKEKMEEYAKRVSEQVLLPNPVLIGVSFGGMVATEVAKIIPYRRLFTISSARKPSHLPRLATLARYVGFHNLVGMTRSSFGQWVFSKVMGPIDREQDELLKQMLHDTSTQFIQRAVYMILTWQSEVPPPEALTIHGKADLIIPARQDHNLVLSGGHAIVLSHSEKISHFIQQNLSY